MVLANQAQSVLLSAAPSGWSTATQAVNDRDGHGAGHTPLRQTAQVLREAFRSTDVLARLGGDEFAVLAVETDADAATCERDRLQARFDRADVPASVGAATRESAGGLTDAWQRADGDMYRVKNSRRPGPTADAGAS